MIAELYIHTASRNGKTFLKNAFYSQPFKLADITEDRKNKTLHLMLMSSSPGILDNDEYNIKVELEEGCSIVLDTQSYQRMFQMKKGAKQEMDVRLARGSSFVFLPHPSVPHESSIFSTKQTFYLSEDCFLLWCEVLTCGRKLSGEIFRFSKFHSQTEIFLSGKLIVKENLLISPAMVDVNAMGQLEGFTHQASLICIGELISVISSIEEIQRLLENEKDICFGISALSVNGFVIRMMGYRSEQLYDIVKLIALHLSASQQSAEISKTPIHAK